MGWWNLLTEQERSRWMSRAGNTGRAVDAWAVYKRDSFSEGDMSDKSNAGSAALPPAMNAPEFEAISAMRSWSARQAELPAIEEEGGKALGRLFKVAQGDTGQSRRVAAFLLGCYNGERFPFDLTDFRTLDYSLFADCMAVLRMDYSPRQEVHQYFDQGGRHFEQLAKDHGLTDFYKLRREFDALKQKLGPD